MHCVNDYCEYNVTVTDYLLLQMFVDVLTRTTGDAGKVLQFALMEVLTRTNGDAGKVLQFAKYLEAFTYYQSVPSCT
jgi:hypothetical protein